MKKCLIMGLMICMLLAMAARAEEPAANLLPAPEEVAALTGDDGAADNFVVWFEEGFGVSIPAGWVSYPVSAEDQAAGVRYALGDGSGHYLYVQMRATTLRDAKALARAVEGEEALSKTGELSFGGQSFVAFIDTAQNASCCATLWGGDLVVFMFTPQTDTDFMLTATELMQTFTAA